MTLRHVSYTVARCVLLLVFCVSAVAVGGSPAVAELRLQTAGAEQDPTMPELREKLLAAVEVDQKARFKLIDEMKKATADGRPGQPSPETIAELTKIDEENTAWLSNVIDESG